MQITNNKTTVQLNEQKILDLIVRPDVVRLERVFSEYYQCRFLDIPTDARDTFFYLCRIALDIKTPEISDIYDVYDGDLKEIIQKCFTKMGTNKAYSELLYKLWKMYENKKNVA